MTVTGSISEMGYIALKSRDLTASVKHANDILGLRTIEDSASKVFLSAQNTQHELIYRKGDIDAVDHFGLVAASRDDLAAIREKVSRGGWRVVSEQPIEDHIEEGFAFVGPEGFTWHIYLPVERRDIRLGGFGPDRFGHINVRAQNSVALKDFLIDTFGFRLSDQIGHDSAFFLRCNNDHHGIAIMKSPTSGLHHFAWQTQSIADIGRLGDRLARSGGRLAWGPVRHGAGHNIAGYYLEPNGGIVELYTDLEQIFDPERKVVVWGEDDLFWLNQWDGNVPWPLFQVGLPNDAR
ncbi:VOC family protein [soil metagenome]